MNINFYIEKWQGDRPYMEDVAEIQEISDSKNQDPTQIFAIFDGHGGISAANYAANNLLGSMHSECMWQLNEADLISSIQNSFKSTHHAMSLIRNSWPQTIEARPSNSGTTASIVTIHKNTLVISHVGDSTVIVAKKNLINSKLLPLYITYDHKPNSEDELARIEACGGSVAVKKGVHRVVWSRKLKQSTENVQIPFLALSRSLGDLWSYNEEHKEFIVSPIPDVKVLHLEPGDHGYIVLASDGLWNMLTPSTVLSLLERAENFINKSVSPAAMLMEIACARWASRDLRADNICIIVIKYNYSDNGTTSQLSRAPFLNSETTLNPADAMADEMDENVCPMDSYNPEVGCENMDESVMDTSCNSKDSARLKTKRYSLDSYQTSSSTRSLLHDNSKSLTPGYLRRSSVRLQTRSFRVPTTPEEKARYWRKRYRLAP